MQDESYQKGLAKLRTMTDEEGIKMIESYGNISPRFVEMMIGFGFGEVYDRDVLSQKQRTLITLSSLITQGAYEQLNFHIRAALKAGLTPEEIVEVMLQCAAYAGFPKAASAIRIAGEIFDELGVSAVPEESRND
ncbi:carboxymuconolactone decarboxylase family protein [Alkalicoccus urumqiensis]|uniref:Carboxymuconolactone decarboxylase n=1 Tax=Alkalicoccus urumqiensis TaxID=1548213 RepID=A0A2P6MIL8_ALKUR|nr:carboxymuconolactone decarboxylase family protein [Alkalicoccus urumqiensis]PRO66111.1 carboxymuconolactone decarboxylase [Alkalicoccus urumqiensis]